MAINHNKVHETEGFDSFTYEIVESYGVLSTGSKGWTKEFNKVSFNGNPAKYDLRDWSPDHEKMGKGITFTDEEAEELFKILKKLDEN